MPGPGRSEDSANPFRELRIRPRRGRHFADSRVWKKGSKTFWPLVPTNFFVKQYYQGEAEKYNTGYKIVDIEV